MRAAFALSLALYAAPAAAQDAAPAQPEPTTLRYDEDWSVLAEPAAHTGRWIERFKYQPIGRDAWIGTGVEIRARVERYDGNLWGDAPDQTDRYLRLLPYLDAHAGPFRAFVQPIVTHAGGIRPDAGGTDTTGADLLQGFGEVSLDGVTLRAGRQMVILGSERLVGTRYGVNVPRAFDGVRVDLARGDATFSLLALRPVAPGTRDFDDHSSHAELLWGAYAALPQIDFYYLGKRNRSPRSPDARGAEVRHSFGMRVHGSHADWHWNVEGVAQVGTAGGAKVRAWTVATEMGRGFTLGNMPADAQLRFDVASGDTKPGDRRIGTFDALYPKAKYFGELTPLGPYNLINLNPKLSIVPADGVSASIAANLYWRQSRNDGVYGIPGNLLRAPGDSRARHIGSQAEAVIEWQATPVLDLLLSASLFRPGAFLRDTGGGRTMTLLALETSFRF
ncbi:alginate export family protein [Sphingosinithalassobacter portus]|uniref:alginate export family protein n=1 Tax=Stakelama portus TaxID=2676234 RepID=UPI000D6DCE03|nr:alginate export family protein [Sphingosinithalassobacter portus]